MFFRWCLAVLLTLGAAYGDEVDFEFMANECFTGSFAIDVSEVPGVSKAPRQDDKTYILNDYVFTCDGTVNSYNFLAASTGKFVVLVFRPKRNEGKIHLVGFNTITVHTAGAQVQQIPPEERIDIVVGDVLALALPEGQVISIGLLETSNAQARASPVFFLDDIPSDVKEEQNFEMAYPAFVTGDGYTAGITAFVQGLTQYLRLVGGSESHKGISEMFKEGEWGRICDTWFHTKGWPNIFCKSLGFPESKHARYVTKEESDTHEQLFMKNLKCKASEIKVLFNCQLLPYDGCNPLLQVFVECEKRVRLDGAQNPCHGVPQVWKFGTWHTICDSAHDTTWHSNNLANSWTKAVCQEMGCPSGNIGTFYAKDKLNGYNPKGSPKYPNPICSIENPATILECPRLSGQTCGLQHDYFVECNEATAP